MAAVRLLASACSLLEPFSPSLPVLKEDLYGPCTSTLSSPMLCVQHGRTRPQHARSSARIYGGGESQSVRSVWLYIGHTARTPGAQGHHDGLVALHRLLHFLCGPKAAPDHLVVTEGVHVDDLEADAFTCHRIVCCSAVITEMHFIRHTHHPSFSASHLPGTPTLGLYQPRTPRAAATRLLPGLRRWPGRFVPSPHDCQPCAPLGRACCRMGSFFGGQTQQPTT